MSPQTSKVPRGAQAGNTTDLDLLKNTQAYLRALQQQHPPDIEWLRCWERFYEIYDPLLRSFAVSCDVAQSDLNDCVQDAWAAISARLPDLNYDPARAPLHSWMYTVVHSKAVDILRRRSRHRFQSLQNEVVIAVLQRASRILHWPTNGTAGKRSSTTCCPNFATASRR